MDGLNAGEAPPVLRKISLSGKLSQIAEHWTPRVVAELNGQHVKLAKLSGGFVWHHHAGEDELFLVLHGRLRMEYRGADGRESHLVLEEGELLVVPRGVEHRPVAEQEVWILLFEPAGTVNTGNVKSELTVERPERL